MSEDKSYQPINSPVYSNDGGSSLTESKSKAGPLMLLAGASALAISAGLLLFSPSSKQGPAPRGPSNQPSKVETIAAPQVPEDVTIAPPDTSSDLQTQLELERRLRAEAEQARLQSEEAARLAEAERLRALQEENDQKAQDRYRSPMIVSETLDDSLAPGEPPKEDEAGATFQETNVNSQFLSARAGAKLEVAKAEKMARPDATIIQGTIIKGALETAVNTDLPGMVRAVTTEDVWSYDGRRVLIPAGSRLVGEYNSGLQNGQKRFFVVWSRIIRPDGVSVQVGSYGTDDLGRSGLSGNLDNHNFERFGAAFLMSVIAAGAQVATVATTSNSGPSDITTSRINPETGEVEQITVRNRSGQNADMAAKGVAALAQGLGGTAQELFKGNMAIPPTITVNQGTNIAVSVRRDLDFSAYYPDPLIEKLRELRRNQVRK